MSRSSAEAEYRAVAKAVAESCWVRQLLHELHRPIDSATIVYCNNISAAYLSANPVQHRRMKHIDLDIHFVREKVALGAVCVLHVPSSSQFADIFTKGLPTALFHDFRTSLHVAALPGSDCGGVLEHDRMAVSGRSDSSASGTSGAAHLGVHAKPHIDGMVSTVHGNCLL